MEKAMMGIMMAVIVIAVMSQAVQAFQPAGPQYQCPICGEFFYTYEELYQHFTIEHPSQPIDIILE